jgi:hypothetical protein
MALPYCPMHAVRAVYCTDGAVCDS